MPWGRPTDFREEFVEQARKLAQLRPIYASRPRPPTPTRMWCESAFSVEIDEREDASPFIDKRNFLLTRTKV
jgi:hypothetical protein